MKTRLYAVTAMIVLPACLYAFYQGTPASAPPTPAHFTADAASLKWEPMFLGLERAVVSGDPSKAGPFVMRLRSVKAATIAAHWHPTDENVTVLKGTLKLGAGDKYDAKALHAMTAGAYSFMPANMRHFGTFAPGTVIQIHGVGPFVLNFVNPADDPRNATKK